MIEKPEPYTPRSRDEILDAITGFSDWMNHKKSIRELTNEYEKKINELKKHYEK